MRPNCLNEDEFLQSTDETLIQHQNAHIIFNKNIAIGTHTCYGSTLKNIELKVKEKWYPYIKNLLHLFLRSSYDCFPLLPGSMGTHYFRW